MIDLENKQRQAVVEEAKSWLNTPYHHLGRIKGAGVDCAQLPIMVYSKSGIISEFDPGNYDQQWYLHHSEEKYLEQVERYAQEFFGPALPGDFLVFKFGRTFSHGTIVIKWPLVIHAWLKDRKVCYGDASRGELFRKQVKFYTFWSR